MAPMVSSGVLVLRGDFAFEPGSGGSGDGTWGSRAPGFFTPPSVVPAADTGFDPGVGGTGGIGISRDWLNNTGSAVALDELLWDAEQVTGGFTYTVAFVDQAHLPINGSAVGGVSSYVDANVSLASLPALLPGKTVRYTFTLVANAATNFDNIAITGTLVPIPETSGVLALSCLITGGLFMRNRRRVSVPSA